MSQELAHKPHERWPEAAKIEAAQVFAVTGSQMRVERELGIPHETVGHWYRNDPEWLESVQTLQQEKSNEQRAKYSEIVSKAQERTLEALPEASAAQASIIAATATDKVRVIDGMPTSIRGSDSTIADLAKQFQKLSRDHAAIQDSVVAVQDQEPEQ